MINYNTATLEELFNELKIIEVQLVKKLQDLQKNYKREIVKIKDNIKVLSLKIANKPTNTDECLDDIKIEIDNLDYLEEYYKSHSFKKLLTNSEDILTIINKLLSEQVIKKISVNQLKRVAENNRIKYLGKFENAYSGIVEDKNPLSMYNKSCEIDEFLSNLINITKNLEDSIEENNPLINTKKVENKLHASKLAEAETIKNKFPYKLPKGTEWKNFIIKFIDNENVFIKVNKYKHTANYLEMGFVGRGKNPVPSVAWIFLKVLARLNGEIQIKDKEASDKYKKQKEQLSNILASYFSIDYDPFFPYKSSQEKKGNSYRIKIVLIPPPEENDMQKNLATKEYLIE